MLFFISATRQQKALKNSEMSFKNMYFWIRKL